MLRYRSHTPGATPLVIVIMMLPYSIAIPVLIIRTPVIGGFSGTQSNIGSFTRFQL
jgi:hypothetical protein